MTRLKIRSRLTLSFSAITIFAIILCAGTIYPLVKNIVQNNIENELINTTSTVADMVQAAINVSVRNHLRAVSETNLQNIQTIYEEYKSGELTEAEAKNKAEKLILNQKIGKKGYNYCLHSNGSIAVHPNSKLVGINVDNFDFIQKQLALKTGYIEYDWANPNEGDKKAKALFMAYFKPWDWIISASAYRNDFVSLVNAEDFREKIKAVRLGKSGYVFIIGKDEEVIVHPWISGTMKEFYDILGYQVLSDIYQKKNGKIKYNLVDQNSKKNREKIAIFKYLPEMDWIVASSMYTDEIYYPLKQIIYFIIFSIFISLVLALPLSALIGNSITIPINKLVALFSDAAKGNWTTRSKNNSPDEIGVLSRKFNKFMDDFQGIQCNLSTEVATRQESEYQRKLFEEVFNNAMEGITITDFNGNIIKANPAFTTITGYDVDEVIGKNPNILKSNKHGKDFYKTMWEEIVETGHWVGEIWNRRKNGESFPELLSISAIHDSSNETTHYVAVFHDITEMKSKEKQIKYQSHHDALTGLPNRVLLIDRIAMAISRARRQNTKLSLFYLDLDNFKTINDSLGHALGDIILQITANRISEIFGNQDIISRLGGDEFVIMIEDVKDEFHLINQAEILLKAFSKPYKVNGHELYVSTSLGITLYPDDGEDPGTLIKNADIAMYQAKEEGKNGYHMFKQEMHDRIERRLNIENALRQAVNKNEFAVFYQPKVNIKTGKVYGLEALIRWVQPNGEVISPAEFIPLAEETGLIIDIGKFVFKESCIIQREIIEKTGLNLIISINVSGRQLKHHDLIEDIKNIVDNSGCHSKKIELEITESMLMDNTEKTIATLNQISAMGFSLSIDDFGTGYSSLAYLKKFPINTLKIDRSFITDMADHGEDESIVQTIIDMSKNLKLKVVAEGVETKEQAEILKKLGCYRIQGYLYAKPMPINELIPFLINWE